MPAVKNNSSSNVADDCYWQHDVSIKERFKCFDEESSVCFRCCTERCPVETPDWFALCATAGHPTWPSVTSRTQGGPIPRKLVCLESSWEYRVFHEKSVKGFLESVASLADPPLILAHHFVASTKHLAHYTRRPEGLLWSEEISWDTPLYYMAFHGAPGTIDSALDRIDSKALCNNFRDFDGYPNIIYFGSCSVLKGRRGQAFGRELLRASGSRAVIGYTTDVDWMDSMAVDLMFIHRFFMDDDPWKNLGKIVASIIADFRPAKAMGYTVLQASSAE